MRAESWTAIYEAQLERYRTIFSADHNMDAKSGVMLGATLAITAFVLNKELFLTQNKFLFTFVVLGCVSYLATLVTTIYVLRPRRSYSLPAVTTKDRPDYLAKNDDDLMYQMIVDAEDATDKIEIILRAKAAAFRAGVWCFAVGTVILLGVKLVGG